MKAEEACSYRGGGGTGLHCNSLDVNGNYTAEATWTCSPVVAESEMCNSTVWCASGICDSGHVRVHEPDVLLHVVLVRRADVRALIANPVLRGGATSPRRS